jgi:predicted transcriptional regulator
MQKLTPQEEEVMQSIWKVGENNIKAFLEQMPEPKPPYTTLASTVKKLGKKGYIKSRLIGNVYLFKPSISEQDYKKKFMSGFVQEYFDNSYKEMVTFFIKQKKLSAQELKELIDIIENDKK